MGADITEVIITNSDASMGSDAFRGCSRHTCIAIPALGHKEVALKVKAAACTAADLTSDDCFFQEGL